jgi:hypothetical protein
MQIYTHSNKPGIINCSFFRLIQSYLKFRISFNAIDIKVQQYYKKSKYMNISKFALKFEFRMNLFTRNLS